MPIVGEQATIQAKTREFQLIRYRQKLAAKGHEPITAVIATERQPSDSSWQELCAHEGIVLLWPHVAENRLKDLFAAKDT